MIVSEDMIERGLALLERLAVSNERIVEMANEERQANYEGGPPYCPWCGAFNPGVTSQGGTGEFAKFALVARCEGCGKVFFGQPEGWQVFRTREEYEEAVAGVADR